MTSALRPAVIDIGWSFQVTALITVDGRAGMSSSRVATSSISTFTRVFPTRYARVYPRATAGYRNPAVGSSPLAIQHNGPKCNENQPNSACAGVACGVRELLRQVEDAPRPQFALLDLGQRN